MLYSTWTIAAALGVTWSSTSVLSSDVIRGGEITDRDEVAALSFSCFPETVAWTFYGKPLDRYCMDSDI